MNIEDLFKYSFVISVDDIRYNWYKKVFSYFNLPLSEKIGTKIETQSKTENCGYNHLQCIKLALERHYPYVTIFEDDAYPRKDIREYLIIFLAKLNEYIIHSKIDLLYLGYYTLNKVQINKENYIQKCPELWGSHAYIIFDCFYQQYIKLCEENKDNIINKIDYIHKFSNNSYICTDRLFEQYTSTLEVDHIHMKSLIPGKFKSESYNIIKKKNVFDVNLENYEEIK